MEISYQPRPLIDRHCGNRIFEMQRFRLYHGLSFFSMIHEMAKYTKKLRLRFNFNYLRKWLFQNVVNFFLIKKPRVCLKHRLRFFSYPMQAPQKYLDMYPNVTHANRRISLGWFKSSWNWGGQHLFSLYNRCFIFLVAKIKIRHGPLSLTWIKL